MLQTIAVAVFPEDEMVEVRWTERISPELHPSLCLLLEDAIDDIAGVEHVEFHRYRGRIFCAVHARPLLEVAGELLNLFSTGTTIDQAFVRAFGGYLLDHDVAVCYREDPDDDDKPEAVPTP